MSEPNAPATSTDSRSGWLNVDRIFLIFNVVVSIGLLTSFVSIFDGGPLGLLELQISRNSEAFTLCLLVSLDLQFVFGSRPSRRPLWWAFLAAAYLVTEFADGLPGTVVTLSESFLGALLISVFFAVFEPGTPRWRWRWLAPALGLSVVLVGELPLATFERVSPWIVLKAETWGFVMLIAILVSYLSSYPWPEVRPTAKSRAVWILTIIVLPLFIAAINPHGVDSVAAIGPIESSMVWIQRITESFIAAVLLTGLFWLLEAKRDPGEVHLPINP